MSRATAAAPAARAGAIRRRRAAGDAEVLRGLAAIAGVS